MLIVFFDVKNDGARDGNLGQQVLIPQNEKNLASLFVLLPQFVMVLDGEIFFSQLVSILIRLNTSTFYLLIVSLGLGLEGLIISVSQRENVPIYLNDKKREINIRQIKVN